MRPMRAGQLLAPLLVNVLLLLPLAVGQRQRPIAAERWSRGQRVPRPVAAADNHDEFYIVLDAASVFHCRDVDNRLSIAKEDVSVSDGRGNRVHYIKAPGNYTIHFRRITAPDDLPNLSGEIAADLQVPLVDGPNGVRLDFPYTVIPETGIVSSRCDAHSGIVQHKAPNGENRQYCRYCDVCSSADAAESELNAGGRGRKVIPRDGLEANRVDAGGQGDQPRCSKIAAGVYEFKREVVLPGRRELERRVRQRYGDLQNEVRKRLERATGRFQVLLNVFSSDEPPRDPKEFLSAHPTCRCCLGSWFTGGLECLLSRFLKCSEEKCKGEYAAACLRGEPRHVACYTVEFNYEATSDFNRVRRLLARRGVDADNPGRVPEWRPPPAPTPPVRPTASTPPQTPMPTDADAGELRRRRCVQEMSGRQPLPAADAFLPRYCALFWDDKCCAACPDTCGRR